MQAEYNTMRTIRDIALKHRNAMVLVVHARKAPGELVDVVQGTMGNPAASDALWVLNRDVHGNVLFSVTDDIPTVFGARRTDQAGRLPARAMKSPRHRTQRDLGFAPREWPDENRPNSPNVAQEPYCANPCKLTITTYQCTQYGTYRI